MWFCCTSNSPLARHVDKAKKETELSALSPSAVVHRARNNPFPSLLSISKNFLELSEIHIGAGIPGLLDA